MIAYVIYPDFTALDLVGPTRSSAAGPRPTCTSSRALSNRFGCDCGLTVIPTDIAATLPDPDLIVVPGSGKPAAGAGR